MSFPTTQWTRLAEASLHGGEAAREALDALCRQYWQPVFLAFRARDLDEEHARDATQGFFLHTMKTSLFRKADPLRGKFRTFLSGAMRLFFIENYHRKAVRRNRYGAREVPLEEAGSEALSQAGPADVVFDREWALTILEVTLQRLSREYEEQRRAEVFAVVKQFLPSGRIAVPDYESASALVGMTPGALRTEVSRARRQFRILLKREVARTVSAPHEIEEELKHIKQVLLHG